MTSYEARKLWRRILISSGTFLLGEIGTSALFGLGKSSVFIGASWGSPSTILSSAGLAATQGAIALFKNYAILLIDLIHLH